jgi:gluconolactonase
MIFCETFSYGMNIDITGNIYLSGKGVTNLERKGVLAGNIPDPENWPANICFGGENMKSLYIAAHKCSTEYIQR